MKKTLIVAAVTASFATAASAQSSVTLYGLVDAGFTYVNNELSMASSQANHGSRFSVNGGNMQQSFWGMRGRESLGGGTSAVFTLENGFDVANGQSTNGRAFGRQAFVGLSNNQYGTLTLGRQNNLVADYLGPLTATGSFGGTYFAHPFNNDQANADQAAHLNNSVKYQSANYAGLTFGGEYGFSNAAGAFAANRAYSFGAGYANGPLKVAAAYLQTQATNSRNANGAIQDPGLSVTLNGGTQQQLSLTSESNRTYGVGGSYDIGAATIGLDWTQSRLQFGYLDSSLRFNNYEINGKYALTPALLIGAAYTYTESKLGAPGERNERHGRWHQFGLTSDYSLSKRTDIYAAAVYQKSNNETASEISGTNAPSASTNQVVVTTGIRHRF